MQRIQRSLLVRTLLPAAAVIAAPAALAQISFSTSTNVNTGARAGGPTLADLDGDGILDLAVVTDGAGNQDLVELFRGDGAGAFAAAGLVFLPNGSSPQDIAAADVDGDGDTDLAVVLEDFAQVVVARNNGAFSFTVLPGAPTGGAGSRIIETADMDGDCDPDFVVASRDSSSVSVLLNVAGTLTLASTTAAGQETRDIALGDWDGDRNIDVAAASHDSRQVVILRGVGGGVLAASQVLSVPAGTRPSGMAAADVDGDGDLDVLAGAGDDNNAFQNFVAIYTNTGGTFSGPLGFVTGGLDAGDLLAADFDLDGDVDVAVANETSGTIGFLENLGGGAFGPPTLLNHGGMLGTLEGGDVDGNGSPDVAITRRQSPGVTVYRNDASGSGGVGTNYCQANPNSTNVAARMVGSGSPSVTQNNLTVSSSSMPQNSAGYFLTSRSSGFVANPSGSAGNLCLGGEIGRYSTSVMNSGAAGEMSQLIDLNQMPSPTGFVVACAGETWFFQCWFRDSVLGSPTSNFSDGLSVTLN